MTAAYRFVLLIINLLLLLQPMIAGALEISENPDVYLTTPEIIRRYGYPAETHTIQTTDGYFLNIHRIPNTDKPVVFLQHGLLSSSADWVLAGPENSLAFLLADSGYDVWMGNCRGNTYCKTHREFPPASQEFWAFSWDEMAQFDLPAVIDYVINVTNRQEVTYVGHSMGTTIFFALASTFPEYRAKINGMVALAPVASVKNIQSPLRILSPWVNDLEFLQKLLGIRQLLPQSKLLEFMSRYLCEEGEVGKDVCENLMFVFAGYDKEQLSDRLLPVIVSHAPAGTSSLTAIQFAQQIKSGRFSRFDFGPEKNLEKYNVTLPPLYQPEVIDTPVALFYADNDLFVSSVDLQFLKTRLPRIVFSYRVPYKKFNHIDFMYAKDVRKLVYNQVIQIIDKFNGNLV